MAFFIGVGGMLLFVLVYGYILIQQEKKEEKRLRRVS